MVQLLRGLKTVHDFVDISKSYALLPAEVQQSLIFLLFLQLLKDLRFLRRLRIDFFHLEISRVVRIFQLIV
jgi:hypothetical protein